MSAARYRLDDPPFAGRTGRGVMVAVIDSGIHASHPHIGGGVSAGIHIAPDGDDADCLDYLGHGTAVAAAIREKAPAVELLAVRVFDRTLATSANVLARGITWAAERGARLVNLSLGTTNAARASALGAAVEHAASRGAIVVSARESNGTNWLPGGLPGVAGVLLDWERERDEIDVGLDESGALVFRASGYPRPIPGVPPERNLSGISFAVANVTGFLARLLEGEPALRRAQEIGARLRRNHHAPDAGRQG